jgi:hypothetical protein
MIRSADRHPVNCGLSETTACRRDLLMIRTRFLATALALASPLAIAQAPAPVLTPLTAVDVKPVADARPLNVESLDAFKGEGLFYFSGTRMVNLRISGPPQGIRYPLAEAATDQSVGAFNANIDARHFVRDGERLPIGQPDFAVPTGDGAVQLIYRASSPLHVKVALQGFDVSGLPIRSFLRTTDNFTKPEATRVGEARFPAGSVAYLTSVRFQDDVLMLPRKESFTGAANTRQMVANFSRDIPFCLSYEDRNGARPYAMMFRDAGATRGRVQLYAAKTGTNFCARAGDEALAEGSWEETTVGGTKAVVLSFGANVDPADTGVVDVEREAARIAFIEPRQGAPGVRPGKLYRAGAKIADYQYRFNATAAAAIRAALGMP